MFLEIVETRVRSSLGSVQKISAISRWWIWIIYHKKTEKRITVVPMSVWYVTPWRLSHLAHRRRYVIHTQRKKNTEILLAAVLLGYFCECTNICFFYLSLLLDVKYPSIQERWEKIKSGWRWIRTSHLIVTRWIG